MLPTDWQRSVTTNRMAAYPGDRDSEYRSNQAASPKPYCNQCRGCHPDAKLVSIFQQTDRPEAEVTFSAYPAIGLIAVQMGVDLRPGKDLDQANRNVGHARDDEGFGGHAKRYRVGEINTPKEVRDAPGKNLIEFATNHNGKGLHVSQSREHGNCAPSQHWKVPEAELETEEAFPVEEQNTHKAGDSRNACLGEEVIRRQACSQYPVGKWVIGLGKGGGGQHRPAADEIDEDGNANRVASKAKEADRDPCRQCYQRRNHHVFRKAA